MTRTGVLAVFLTASLGAALIEATALATAPESSSARLDAPAYHLTVEEGTGIGWVPVV